MRWMEGGDEMQGGWREGMRCEVDGWEGMRCEVDGGRDVESEEEEGGYEGS